MANSKQQQAISKRRHSEGVSSKVVQGAAAKPTSGENRNGNDTSSPATATELDKNPDYLALQSALTLLAEQRQAAETHIVHLAELRETYLLQPHLFIKGLKEATLDIPPSQHILKCPRVEWSRYYPEGSVLPQQAHLPVVVEQGVVDNVVMKHTTVFTKGDTLDDRVNNNNNNNSATAIGRQIV